MFLTVGDKIKAARKKYDLKQIAFEPYGFSRNYISMIETNKRSLNEEALLCLYKALCELTDLAFEQEYSYESFSDTPGQQAEKWLTEQINVGDIHSQYDYLIQVAREYNLNHMLIKIEFLMGNYYQAQHDYIKASYHYVKSISYCEERDEMTSKLYHFAGTNLLKSGKYKEALSHFELALKGIDEANPSFYKINYNIAISYLYDNEYEKSLHWVEKIINQTQDLKTKALSYLIKETALKKLGHSEEGRKVLLEFIEKDLYPSYLSIAWHNLGCNYNDCQLYDEALEALNIALTYPHDELGGVLIEGLIGEIHYKIGNLDQSLNLFHQTKSLALQLGNPTQRLIFLEWGINLYWKLKQYDSIIELLSEAQALVNDSKISKVTYSELQNRLYRTILNHMILNPEDKLNYLKVLKVVK